MIKALQLKNLKLTSNIIQAPLAGYSCAPFRVLAQKYGQPGFCVTEMISAHDLVHRKNKPKRYLYKDPEEGLLSYQISGNDPEIIARATEYLSKINAQIIDLNCGCPVDKIRKKNAGSKLLQTPEKIFQLISAIKNNTDAVVSIKIRVATPHNDHDEKELLDAISKAQVDFITVHGRHWTEKYDVSCQIDAIARIVSMTKIPVIANGDVSDYENFKNIMEKTGCAGVMIGRAGVGQPWIYKKILSESQGEEFNMPSIAEIGIYYLEHLQGLIELENEKLAVLQARKLAKYYAREIPERHEFVELIQQANSFLEINKITRNYFC